MCHPSVRVESPSPHPLYANDKSSLTKITGMIYLWKDGFASYWPEESHIGLKVKNDYALIEEISEWTETLVFVEKSDRSKAVR